MTASNTTNSVGTDNFFETAVVLCAVAFTFSVGCDGLFYDLEELDDLQPAGDCDRGAAEFSGGEGTDESPWRICNAGDLMDVGDADLGDSFALFDDIDLTELDSSFAVVGDSSEPFEGRFDGNGYEVTGLHLDIDDADGPVGLFGMVDGGRIEDVRLEDLEITVAFDESSTEETSVGGLVGHNDGTIEGSRVTGKIRGLAADEDDDQSWAATGGLVGFNEGKVVDSSASVDVRGHQLVGGLVGYSDRGTIEGSFAEGDVEGYRLAGGLVGENLDAQTTGSYATGDVEAEVWAGGLCGNIEGGQIGSSYATGDAEASVGSVGGLCGAVTQATVETSYALGDTTGGDGIGGLIGDSFGQVRIVHCYAAGFPEGEDVGGLIGAADAELVVDASYWDTDISRIDDSDWEGAEGLTTGEFSDVDNYDGWDFDNVWAVESDADGNRRAQLRWALDGGQMD